MKNWNHVNDPVKITETRLCEVLLLTLKHKSVLQLATEGLTTEPLKKGGHGQGIYGRAKPSGAAVIYPTKLMIRFDIFMPGGPHASNLKL